jgi:type I restriction enzyme S subunit
MFIIKLPSLSEQQKIALVFLAADKEIENHQQELEALKQQKKGLMQQLLTGKKRVKLKE